MSLPKLFVYGLLFIIVILIPFIIGSKYITHVLIICCIWAIMSTGYNLVLGYTGLFSIGHAAFIAIGAYSSTLLVMNFGVPWPVGILFAMTVVGIFAVVTGAPFVRLGGPYFAFITLGLAEIVRYLIIKFESLTGGHLGIIDVPSLSESLSISYIYVILAMMLVLLIVYRIIHSSIGRAFIGIRENMDVAASFGINVAKYRFWAYVISAIICGMGGAMLVHYIGHCYPGLSGILLSVNLMVYTIVGGRGTILGPVVAAFFFTLLPESVRFIDTYRPLIYAVILVLVIIAAPRGLEPILRSLFSAAASHVRLQRLTKRG